MLENLIKIITQKTADGNIKWNNMVAKWGCEYGKSFSVVGRNSTLKCELYYSDKSGKVTDVVFVVYELNDKLSHVTSDDYPALKELAQDLYALQIASSDRVMTDAFRALSGMPTKERIIPKVEKGRVVKEKPKKKEDPKVVTKTKTVTKTKIVEVEKDDSGLPGWKKWIKNRLDL